MSNILKDKYICFKLFFLILLNNSFFQCVLAKLKPENIVGGNAAEIGQFQYLVSVQGNKYHMCGGGIIGNQHVLTAAHCFIGEDENFMNLEYSILAATIDASYTPTLTESAFRIPVEKVYVPKEFFRKNPDSRIVYYRSIGDIAVLKLARKFNRIEKSQIEKLYLPISSTSVPLYVNDKAIFAGFGYERITYQFDPLTKTQIEIPITATFKLRYAETIIFSNKVCEKKYMHPIFESHICAQVKQRNINVPEGKCSGDSGGPLVFQDSIIIGISSSSNIGCDERLAPGVYTRITHYLPFIQNALRDIDSPLIRTKVYKN